MQYHEAKAQPVARDETVIVSAFGMRKCPKLVEQVQSETLKVRQNALAVLCDEMHDPQAVAGCIEAGVMPLLAQYVPRDADELTRERASKALSFLALDANGRRAMLQDNVVTAIMPALDDRDVMVRRNVYEALVNFSSSLSACAKALVEAEYPHVLVEKAGKEVPEVQSLILQVLYNCIKDDRGLEFALRAGAVHQCIALLASDTTAVRKEAANTLSSLCFAESAKGDAIEGGAMKPLCALLSDAAWQVRSAAAAAVMAITTTDAGKKEIVPAEGVEPLIQLLLERHRSLKLNVLKTIANVAVNPAVRDQLKLSEVVLPALTELVEGSDELLAKHATTAKNAVLWEP